MTALAPALQAYFTERLITQRSSSPETIAAYRHAFRLLLRFAQERTGKQRSRSAGRSVRAGNPVPTRLGGRPDTRARRHARASRRRPRARRGDRHQPGRILGPPRAGVRAPARRRRGRPRRRRRVQLLA
ncbi:MAG: site-specific integrase [Solirubrobacterales bacterium]|nr:site-specific integrase [Solirubrobacterales bacterium]